MNWIKQMCVKCIKQILDFKSGQIRDRSSDYSLYCLCADLAETHEEAGHSWTAVLRFSSLQDQWKTWDPFYHRTFY